MDDFNEITQIIADLQDYQINLRTKLNTFDDPKYKMILEAKINNISKNIGFLNEMLKRGYKIL